MELPNAPVLTCRYCRSIKITDFKYFLDIAVTHSPKIIINSKKTIMKTEDYYNSNLGCYIAQLQSVIKVDGRLLRDEDIVARAHMSKSTYQQIKKG